MFQRRMGTDHLIAIIDSGIWRGYIAAPGASPAVRGEWVRKEFEMAGLRIEPTAARLAAIIGAGMEEAHRDLNYEAIARTVLKRLKESEMRIRVADPGRAYKTMDEHEARQLRRQMRS